MVFFVQINCGTTVRMPHGNERPGGMLGPNVRGHTIITMMVEENSLSNRWIYCRCAHPC